MNTSAMILMVLSILLIWGGLVLAVIHLVKHPDIPLDQLDHDL
ncbi:methionine/alanine import family NSS transporter small subunit [Psychrobacter frigidicola]|uniref:Methionine/alanine import family NSS transporter small subunit n=1 Tax=Psychrobacter frigidicola TaxID=45611 RepID=A0A5C7A478_9GAMM|nr:methionine/alanine import family NSS transporter small subunit [Psychrobacter frigidicola]TXD98249.1 methionine/alanine import family NSS transporter small subunit [Psychrobacter frigidicola]